MNPIYEYYQKILDGTEIVPRKVRITYWFIITNVLTSKKFEYNEDLANHALDFIQTFCKHSKGEVGGKPFILELWQKALVAAMFGIVHRGTNIRKYRFVMFMVARKNGKSTLAAAISLYLLIADGEPGPEVYAVATKHAQAKIIWEEATKMINKSSALKKFAKVKHSEIITAFNEGKYVPLGRDSKSLDGLNVHGATLDEIEAWKDMNMYDVMLDATSARLNWMIFGTTTAGTEKSVVFDRLYSDAENQINFFEKGEDIDENTLNIIYELDKRDEWKDFENIRKANPGLGTIKKEKTIREKHKKALRKPELVRNFLAKDCNVPDTSAESWFSLEDIQNDERFVYYADEPNNPLAVKPKYVFGGFDLSETIDMTCATILFMSHSDEKMYMDQMYWIPEDSLEDRESDGIVPYRKWINDGYLRTCQGNRVNHKDVLEWFVEMQRKHRFMYYRIGYDRYSANYLVQEMKDQFGDIVMDQVIQGVYTLSAPMYQLTADMKSSKLVYNQNPIFEWCSMNVKVIPDKNGNIMPMKIKTSKQRIDGFASALNAYVSMERNRSEYIGFIR
ncbi:hypothetical protein AOC36_09575 [Erysipelothrix larvae]|uniref:Terminase n=1 Tax=Erysipelothrix larvae TaxID=1514105 RepID=A0A0X8H1A5_9FIRM|nr:terminase TerL endonuclease subunit [Erysipelothrix larvae]AMC94222.1 hypothetical protein AOC36_09575 [Erysipelothrix larvae]